MTRRRFPKTRCPESVTCGSAESIESCTATRFERKMFPAPRRAQADCDGHRSTPRRTR
jgi:hypothetical protein